MGWVLLLNSKGYPCTKRFNLTEVLVRHEKIFVNMPRVVALQSLKVYEPQVEGQVVGIWVFG